MNLIEHYTWSIQNWILSFVLGIFVSTNIYKHATTNYKNRYHKYQDDLSLRETAQEVLELPDRL